MDQVEFLSNVAAGNGGAAAFTSASATLFDGVFDGNTSEGLGGAIFAPNELLLYRASFTNNTADAEAGAVHFRYGLRRRASFTANSVTGAVGGGGAVSTSSIGGLSPPVAAIESCSFTGNSAPGPGGAILAEGPLRVSNSALHDNTAGTDGGAIFVPDRQHLSLRQRGRGRGRDRGRTRGGRGQRPQRRALGQWYGHRQ